jgi:septum formation protein
VSTKARGNELSAIVPSAIRPELPLLLASASPRRRDLLEVLRLPIVVSAVAIDESALPGEEATAYVERVVFAKLEAAERAAERSGLLHAACLVADTIVVVEGTMLAKPADDADGRAMIRTLAGRSHEVSTRFAIALPGVPGAAHAETVTTRVHVRSLDDRWIERYVATGEGSDKAGGYAIQGIFSAAIPRIEGSYTNVVGLPVAEVIAALQSLGLLQAFPIGGADR